MRIDAITVCVGEMYVEQLARAIPVWLDTLDSLTIATDSAGLAVWLWAQPCAALSPLEKVHFAVTDVFTQHGAAFNKGAALNVAYDQASPSDWVLAFDADIIPPPNWREIVEHEAERGYLHGCGRVREDNQLAIRERILHPLGFFQLWHTSDPRSWRWPLFPPDYPCAGGYDAEFAEHWPRDHWRKLPFDVTHQGEHGVNWFGQGSAEKTIAWRANRGRFGNERLAVPIRHEVLNPDSDPEYAAGILKECRAHGPFGIGQALASGKGVA